MEIIIGLFFIFLFIFIYFAVVGKNNRDKFVEDFFVNTTARDMSNLIKEYFPIGIYRSSKDKDGFEAKLNSSEYVTYFIMTYSRFIRIKSGNTLRGADALRTLTLIETSVTLRRLYKRYVETFEYDKESKFFKKRPILLFSLEDFHKRICLIYESINKDNF